MTRVQASISVSEFLIPKAKIRRAVRDYRDSAALANLIYVHDGEDGIVRKNSNGRFAYYLKNEKISDKKILPRIKQLVVPPA